MREPEIKLMDVVEAPRFTSLLIANRGEIAMRIIRSAKSLGLRTVAVYSEADADLLHVQMADQAICLGAAAAGESYLNIPKVIDAALLSGAQAVHPGYGFLSESPEFAAACREAGLVFIGPSAQAIRDMGNKATAKRIMLDSEVPCIPGYDGGDQGDEAMVREAKRIGYPVMVKAMAGGGGKGMRLVESPEQLADALRGARSEAEKSFGDGRLMLEKAVLNARHIEIQVFGDEAGNFVYLGDRDCSLQRRHQKVIEEAPAPGLPDELRRRMGDAAVRAARAVRYQGAGTVEFLLAGNGEFYFLEMNTRLQVEHPVTELVTGQDLVAWQINVALGRPLPLVQDSIVLAGHAIEARVYAEDPATRFLPQSGRLSIWQPPSGEGIRVDHGIAAGVQVSTHYDPMLAKVISFGADRETARVRLQRAVEDFAIGGIRSNLFFLRQCLIHPEFVRAGFNTGFLERYTPDQDGSKTPSRPLIAAAAAFYYQRNLRQIGASLHGWHSRSPIAQRLALCAGDWEGAVTVTTDARTAGGLRIGDDQGEQFVRLITDDSAARVEVDGIQRTLHHAWVGDALHLVHEGVYFALSPRQADDDEAQMSEGTASLKAPMPAAVAAVNVTLGERVEAGQVVLILEAMKMELELNAPVSGQITQLDVSVGAQVAMHQLLLAVTAESEDGAAN